MLIFSRLLSKPLRLEVGGQAITFLTLADFEFALDGRTEVPGAKVRTLVQLPPEALAREAESIRQVERVFVDALAQSPQTPSAIAQLLRSVDLQSFSTDHQWREIAKALRAHDRHFDEFKRLAIVKYVQYLSARQEVLRELYQDKQRHPSSPSLDAQNADSAEPANADLMETQLLDVRAVRDANVVRLPPGQTVVAHVAPGAGLDLWLSGHRFTLINQEPLALTNEDGEHFPLGPGKNVVGRFQGNDVALGSGYSDISRKHVVIERGDAAHIRLTDLSTHGTSVPETSLSRP